MHLNPLVRILSDCCVAARRLQVRKTKVSTARRLCTLTVPFSLHAVTQLAAFQARFGGGGDRAFLPHLASLVRNTLARCVNDTSSGLHISDSDPENARLSLPTNFQVTSKVPK